MAKAALKVKEVESKSEEFKYGVEDVADILDKEPATVRLKLRALGIRKNNGNQYGWKTKAEVQEIADRIEEKKSAKKASKKEDVKPVKGKTSPKAKSKKNADDDE